MNASTKLTRNAGEISFVFVFPLNLHCGCDATLACSVWLLQRLWLNTKDAEWMKCYVRHVLQSPEPMFEPMFVCFTADCGGPFDLREPNSTFSSPNYPHGYGNKASCEHLSLLLLHTPACVPCYQANDVLINCEPHMLPDTSCVLSWLW